MAQSQTDTPWGQERVADLQQVRHDQAAVTFNGFPLLNGFNDAEPFAKDNLKAKDDLKTKDDVQETIDVLNEGDTDVYKNLAQVASTTRDAQNDPVEAPPVSHHETGVNTHAFTQDHSLPIVCSAGNDELHTAAAVRSFVAVTMVDPPAAAAAAQEGEETPVTTNGRQQVVAISKRARPRVNVISLRPTLSDASQVERGDLDRRQQVTSKRARQSEQGQADSRQEVVASKRARRHEPYSPLRPVPGSRAIAMANGLDVWRVTGFLKNMTRERAKSALQRLFAVIDEFKERWPVMLWGDEPGGRFNNQDKRQEAGGGARGRPSAFGQWEMAFYTPLSVTHEVQVHLPSAWWTDACGGAQGEHSGEVMVVVRLCRIQSRRPGKRDGVG